MKKFLIGVLFALAVGSAQASYLWFAVSQTDDGFSNISSWMSTLSEAGKVTCYDLYARVVAVDGAGNKTTFDGDNDVAGFVNEWNTGAMQSVNIGSMDATQYSYYIEIVNGANNSAVLGSSAVQTYAQIGGGNVTSSLSDVPAAEVWHGGGFTATPEPTSAMLMLLGVAGLALRRKQRKAA